MADDVVPARPAGGTPEAQGRAIGAEDIAVDLLDAEREQFTANLQHDNAAEGLRAFFEKCKPRFS